MSADREGGSLEPNVHTVWIRGETRQEVRGRNWIVALGEALADAGDDTKIVRLACEVLGNGTVIAVNGDTGERYIVSIPELDTDDIEPLTEEVRRSAMVVSMPELDTTLADPITGEARRPRE